MWPWLRLAKLVLRRETVGGQGVRVYLPDQPQSVQLSGCLCWTTFYLSLQTAFYVLSNHFPNCAPTFYRLWGSGNIPLYHLSWRIWSRTVTISGFHFTIIVTKLIHHNNVVMIPVKHLKKSLKIQIDLVNQCLLCILSLFSGKSITSVKVCKKNN